MLAEMGVWSGFAGGVEVLTSWVCGEVPRPGNESPFN